MEHMASTRSLSLCLGSQKTPLNSHACAMTNIKCRNRIIPKTQAPWLQNVVRDESSLEGKFTPI